MVNTEIGIYVVFTTPVATRWLWPWRVCKVDINGEPQTEISYHRELADAVAQANRLCGFSLAPSLTDQVLSLLQGRL